MARPNESIEARVAIEYGCLKGNATHIDGNSDPSFRSNGTHVDSTFDAEEVRKDCENESPAQFEAPELQTTTLLLD